MTKRKPRKVGRPTKLTAYVKKTILRMVSYGATWASISTAVGISAEHLARYRDPEHSSYDAAFAKAVDAARCKMIVTLERRWFEGSKKDHRAAKSRLEHVVPESYSPRVRIDSSSSTTLRLEVAQSLELAAEIRANPALLEQAMASLLNLAQPKALPPADSAPVTHTPEPEVVTLDG